MNTLVSEAGRPSVCQRSPFIVQAANTATITSPTNSATFLAPATVTIESIASASVVSVIFSVIGPAGSIGDVATSAPFQFTASNLVAGSYTSTATPVDSQGAQGSPASVSFIVETLAGPARLSDLAFLPAGRVQFTINGVAGHEYDIQATSALTGGWMTIWTIVAPSVSFPFTEAPVQGQRFYRVVTR